MLIGVDLSVHNGDIDHAKLAARLRDINNGAPGFAVLRVTVGDYYTDPKFVTNWVALSAEGVPLSGYHVITPERNHILQMNRFFSVIGDRRPTIRVLHNGRILVPWWLDCELKRDQTRDTITNCIWYGTQRLDPNAAIYTRKSWWDPNVNRWSGWSEYPLHTAHYTDNSDPYIPADWVSYAWWQWSADNNNRGQEFGVQSDSIDLDRMHPSVIVVDDPVDPTIEERVTNLELRVATLEQLIS